MERKARPLGNAQKIENHEYKGKENFRQSVEKFYFGYASNSKVEADFVEVGT